ncbi:unnamed protein product [Linum tenue]|uniref:DUF1677 family protein n=3 Tax=Linum tenue TaxID=586396 RepID=A0AAV0PIR0_9ROSI|nr:unnamed protein product [Linum tenue]
MSATMISDPLVVSPPETQPLPPPVAAAEVESATCDCCGLTEECTPAYIERVRERYHGKWVCGLCSEAVKDEIVRTEAERLISTEEALARHINFCKKFSSSPEPTPIDPTLHLISAMRQILRRSFDSPRSSPRGPRSTPGSPMTKSVVKLARSESCFTTLSS